MVDGMATERMSTKPRSSKPAARVSWLLLAIGVLAGLSILALTRTNVPESDAAVTVQADRPAGTTMLQIGVTHGKNSADHWEDPDVVTGVVGTLESTAFQNQHIMGWGALNPEPAPGVYQWASLDRRMRLIRDTGGTPVITLCCAPDWMKGGQAGETDWSLLEVAPTVEHYDDFAQLAALVARRYPDVRYFQVWNELKGFYNEEGNHWDAVRYTDFYNHVYDAVKEVRPDALIGGPYTVMDSWAPGDLTHPSSVRGAWGVLDQRALDVVEYWLEHKRDADFLVIDGATTTTSGALLTDPFQATSKFAAVTRWLRARTDLPIWWAEFYVQPHNTAWSAERQNATITAALVEMARAGASVALVWDPVGRDESCKSCLWDDRSGPNGGGPTPLARSLESWASTFPAGTGLVEVTTGSGDVLTLASRDHVLLVNRTSSRLNVSLDGRRIPLDPYEVHYAPLT